MKKYIYPLNKYRYFVFVLLFPCFLAANNQYSPSMMEQFYSIGKTKENTNKNNHKTKQKRDIKTQPFVSNLKTLPKSPIENYDNYLKKTNKDTKIRYFWLGFDKNQVFNSCNNNKNFLSYFIGNVEQYCSCLQNQINQKISKDEYKRFFGIIINEEKIIQNKTNIKSTYYKTRLNPEDSAILKRVNNINMLCIKN